MIFSYKSIPFEECACDLCGKKVGYYSISGTFDFYCSKCFKKVTFKEEKKK